jgi:membrane protease YdiL (CAAX protease family)
MVGLVLFVSLCFLGSWLVAATLRVFGLSVAPEAIGTRLFTTSLLYLATMGWQPLVATWVVRRWIDPPDTLDLGLRPSARVYSLVGGLGAIALALGATLIAAAAVLWDAPGSLSLGAERELGLGRAPFGILSLSAAFVASLVLVWLQAVAEEVGWRGYLLPRAMERFGRWWGLVLHGAVWGLWYAPVLSLRQLRPTGAPHRRRAELASC